MHKHHAKTSSLLLLLALLWACLVPLSVNADAIPADSYRSLSKYSPEQAYFPDKLWLKAATPEVLGWSSGKLAAARQFSSQLDTAAVVIINNGVIVDEWGSPLVRYKCHSMRKSLLNALFGIYVDAGKIRLSDTLETLGIDDWNPPLDRQEKQARVSDLLKSRSGIYHAAAYETENMRAKRPARDSHVPGSYWFYNNWDFNALGSIFEQAAGKSIFDEFQQRIAKPLQMEQFGPGDTEYYFERSKSKHPAYLFRMSARDLARFGLLYLRNGKWKNQQIVSGDWIKESTKPYSDTRKTYVDGYGYLWWVGQDGRYEARGVGGQTLMVHPKRGLVIVHRVNTDGAEKGRVSRRNIDKLFELIMEAGPAQTRPSSAHYLHPLNPPSKPASIQETSGGRCIASQPPYCMAAL